MLLFILVNYNITPYCFAFNELHILITSPSHHLHHAIRKAQESQKEMKLLLDMYKSAPKEQRDKVQLMAAEKKSKAEVCELTKICCISVSKPLTCNSLGVVLL